MSNGGVATYKSHALRVWCLELAPKDKSQQTDLELNDVFFLHDDQRESSFWQRQAHSMQHLADKGIRSFACDMPGYGRSDGDRALARSPEKTRAFILAEMIRLCGTVRPVLVSPGVSGAYSMPLLVYHPETVGGYMAMKTVSTWGDRDGTHVLRDTEKMVEFIKAKAASLPDRGIEIPVKIFVEEKAKNSTLSQVWRDFAGGFPVAEVIEVPKHHGEVYGMPAKEFNDMIVKVCTLAMLSNGRAGDIVRTTLKKKNELMERKRAQDATLDEI